MTTDSGWTDTPFNQDQEPPPAGMYPEHPVHVKVVATESEQVAPEFTSWMNFAVPLAGSTIPMQLCQHRYRRYKAKLIWTIPANTTVWLANKPDPLSTPAPATTISQLTSGVTATIASPAVPASTVAIQSPYSYPVQVVISAGTVTAVTVNGVQVGTGDGTYYVPAYGTISVTYSVAPTWVWSLTTGDLTGLVNWVMPDYDGQQPLYAVYTGTGPVTVTVIDESYGTVQ